MCPTVAATSWVATQLAKASDGSLDLISVSFGRFPAMATTEVQSQSHLANKMRQFALFQVSQQQQKQNNNYRYNNVKRGKLQTLPNYAFRALLFRYTVSTCLLCGFFDAAHEAN